MNCSIISPPLAPNFDLKGSRANQPSGPSFRNKHTPFHNYPVSTSSLHVRFLSSTLTAVEGELQISKVTFMNYHFKKRKKHPIDPDVEEPC